MHSHKESRQRNSSNHCTKQTKNIFDNKWGVEKKSNKTEQRVRKCVWVRDRKRNHALKSQGLSLTLRSEISSLLHRWCIQCNSCSVFDCVRTSNLAHCRSVLVFLSIFIRCAFLCVRLCLSYWNNVLERLRCIFFLTLCLPLSLSLSLDLYPYVSEISGVGFHLKMRRWTHMFDNV